MLRVLHHITLCCITCASNWLMFIFIFPFPPSLKSDQEENQAQRKEKVRGKKTVKKRKKKALHLMHYTILIIYIHLKNTPQPQNIIQTDISTNVYNVRTHQQNSILGIQNKKNFLVYTNVHWTFLHIFCDYFVALSTTADVMAKITENKNLCLFRSFV